MRMHENDWECLRMTQIQWGVCGSFAAELHYTTCMIMNGNAWEWLRLSENVSYAWRGERSFHADLHYTTCMRMNGNSSDYPIIDEHVCDDTAWSCMRMYDNDSYSRGVWVVYGWVAFHDMHDECIRMTRIHGMCGSLKTDLHVTGRIIWHMLPSPPFTRMTTHRFFFS